MKVMRLDKNAQLPTKATSWSAGYDLHALEDVQIPSIERLNGDNWRLIRTGIAVEIPTGCVGMICPRSGLALAKGLTVLNAPGIIDSDYRGEIKVILINLSEYTRQIYPGDRIAQLIISPIVVSAIDEVRYLQPTQRGSDGFGSSGD